ncbi:uncharacterized protein LOC117326798 [Pecten maximus]|uniref:uncharacterized protein LOC117326798 n=1 Tax=Pecten maximus TaxID=6579 RepID=UPI0014591B4A|nr:uncharacterized protein LOC117326798 [Pecten maximus]
MSSTLCFIYYRKRHNRYREQILRALRDSESDEDTSNDNDNDNDSDDDDDEEVIEKFIESPEYIDPGFLPNDVVLVIEDKQLYVNKDLLESSSPVFEAWLKKEWQTEKGTENGKIELSFPGKNFVDMRAFFKCLLPVFSDKVTDENLDTVLPLADEYQTENLLLECIEVIRERVESVYKTDTYIPPSRIVTYVRWVEQFKLNAIRECVVKLAAVIENEDLENAPDYYTVGTLIQLEVAKTRSKLLKDLFVSTPTDAERKISRLQVPRHDKYMSEWKQNVSNLLQYAVDHIGDLKPQLSNFSATPPVLTKNQTRSAGFGKLRPVGIVLNPPQSVVPSFSFEDPISQNMSDLFACISVSDRIDLHDIYNKCIEKLNVENISKGNFQKQWSKHYTGNKIELSNMGRHVLSMYKCTCK